MRYWSEGLGKRELVIGLERAKLERQPDNILLTGIVDSPAPWEYEVKIQFEDWKAILKTATTPEASEFLASHVGIGTLAAMAWSMLQFVFLLAVYRLEWLLGLGRKAGLATTQSLSSPDGRKAKVFPESAKTGAASPVLHAP